MSGILLFGYQCNNRKIFILRIFELMEVFSTVSVGSLKHISKICKSVILKQLLLGLKSIGERSPLHFRDLE